MKTKLYPILTNIIEGLDFTTIPEIRKPILQSVIEFIQTKKDASDQINLNFICTHNSRRSHLAQVWAQAMAEYFNVPNLYCYSGGTEATALFPKVAETLKENGFQIFTLSDEKNPIYCIKFSENVHPVIGFSKTYDHEFNPKSGFAAVMTCSHADENCPFVAGCEKRITLTYDDPKLFDNTVQQTEKYMERSLQIATEMKFIFSNIN